MKQATLATLLVLFAAFMFVIYGQRPEALRVREVLRLWLNKEPGVTPSSWE